MWNPFRRREKAAMQQVSAGGGWTNLFTSAHEPFSGAWQRNVEINTKTVLSYYAVFSCISLISSDIAKMPLRMMQRDSAGIWKESAGAKGASIYRKPNAFQNRIQFFECWLNSKLCHGNTIAIKIRDAKGQVKELRLLDWNKVTPLVSDDGSVFYQINPDNISGVESQVTVPAREIIHDRFNCLFHPLIGLSPIYAAGLAATQGHHIQENSAVFFRNGGKPSGVIEVPGSLSEENAQIIKAAWETGYSGENAGKTAILSNAAKYTPISVNAADSQTVEQLKMSAEIVCSTFHVPAYKVGIGALPSYDNVEALEQQYYAQCLQSLIESIELLLDDAFELGFDFRTEFDVGALLRMDSERRMKTLGDGVKNTILTPNEARRSENLSPVPGGDSLYLQQQNFSLEALARRDASEDPFAKSPSSSAPEPQAGKGYDAETIWVIVHQAVSDAICKTLVQNEDKSALVEEIKGAIVEEMTPVINETIENKVSEIPPPKDGKDCDPEVMRRAVREEVSEAVSKIPVPEDGKSVTVEEILPVLEVLVGNKVSEIPVPLDGKSIGIDEIKPVLEELVGKALDDQHENQSDTDAPLTENEVSLVKAAFRGFLKDE